MKAQRIQSTVVVSWLEDLYVKYVFDCAIAPSLAHLGLHRCCWIQEAAIGLFSGITSIFGGGSLKKASAAAQAVQLKSIGQGIGAIENQDAKTQGNFAPFVNSGLGALSDYDALLGISTPANPGTVDWSKYISMQPDVAYDRTLHTDMSDSDYGQWHYAQDGSRRDLTPYTTGATAAVDGDAAQAAAIDALQKSPLFTSLVRNGEEAIRANASATGGLRGGNIQNSLANFRADTLTQTIENQLQRLGGLTQTGLSAAGTVGGLGANAAGNIADLFGQQGQVKAGGILTRAGITAGQFGAAGGVLDSIGSALSGGGLGALFGSLGGGIKSGGILGSGGKFTPTQQRNLDAGQIFL